MNFGLANAIISLRPNEQWILNGDYYSGLEWMSDTVPPTEEELLEEVDRLQLAYDRMEYSRLRAAEYPSINDYVDGIVKGDQDQIDAYIAECLAVKEKYPKPS